MLAKALLFERELFRECPLPNGAEALDGAGGCQAVTRCGTLPGLDAGSRIGTWSEGCIGGNREAEAFTTAALRKACMCGGSLRVLDDRELEVGELGANDDDDDIVRSGEA